MKRSYPNGAEKRRKREESKKFLAKLPKVTNFFVTSPADDGKAKEQKVADVDLCATTNVSVDTNSIANTEELPVAADSVSNSTSTFTFSDNINVFDEDCSTTSSHSEQCVTVTLEEDPALWPKHLTDKERCSLVQRGPVQIKDRKYPKNKEGRRFTSSNYYLQMKNGEKIKRSWLMYSEKNDCVMCFCCRLFGNQEKDTQLSGDGRLIAIVNHLADHSLAFRDHSDRLFESGNGNFLGQVQLMAQFDSGMREHLRRIQTKELSDTYLSKYIKNELISIVAKCTTDLSVVLRIVNCELSKGVSIHEHFVEFLQALDTTGKQTLGFDLYNCRGQSYDNGSNMQGKEQGVQKRVLELNHKALCAPCGSHTLNLVVGDAAKSSVMSTSFFGLLQRLYTLFSSSVHRWTILKEDVKNFTLKALSATRWECRVEAVKAIRYQLPEIVKALTALKEYATEKRDADVVSTAESICQELQRWHFVVSTIVWYNVLFQINKVSKILQSPKVSVETAREEIRILLVTIEDRFSNTEIFYKLYGFLYSTEIMRSTENEGKLDECCHRLEQILDDIDAEDLKLEDYFSLSLKSLDMESVIARFAEAKARKARF
uniref:TTF-type domain-containing protein n=1 Tax=Sinocyclocheilus grahami TaxID=75366 RepID=A0A672T9W0_SINGR